MAELRDRLRLALEARAPNGVVGDAGRQHLDRDIAIQPCIARPINFAHTAPTDQAEELVGTEACAGGDRHGVRSTRTTRARRTGSGAKDPRWPAGRNPWL